MLSMLFFTFVLVNLLALVYLIVRFCHNSYEISQMTIHFPDGMDSRNKFDYVLEKTAALGDVDIIATTLDMGHYYVFASNLVEYESAKVAIIDYVRRKEDTNA
jgi:hypothetical protein